MSGEEGRQTMHANGQPAFDIVVWWTPDCGYLHLEWNPQTIPAHCPDNHESDETEVP